jgi:transcriptional regulator with XRE-family HTH domain
MGMCKCGGLTKTVPINNYTVPGALLGVQHVTLDDGVLSEECERCKKARLFIPDIPGLIAAVAITRVKLPFKLNHREIKFIRKAIGATGKEIAEYLSVAPETVSRWENEKMPMSEQDEKLFRLVTIGLLRGKAEAVDPEMAAVAKMNIQSAFEPTALADQMHFVRVRVKLKDRAEKPEQLWSDDRKVING